MEKLQLDTQKIERLWHGRTYTELADKMGISRQLLNYYLKSRAVSAAPMIAKALGVDPRDLVK
jgi:transcriptional regulator with XRE-family HTH domain